jgi:hypothetical protein
MCCRISSTGFATRTIAGLYIFLATFLIGFFAVYGSSWLGKISLSEGDGFRLKTLVQTPYEADLCRNNYGIVFSRWHAIPADQEQDSVVFGVSNISSQPIYLEHQSVRVDFWKLGAGPYSYTRTSAIVDQKFDPQPIMIGDVFRLPDLPRIRIGSLETVPFYFTPAEDFEADVSIGFRRSDDEQYREITAHFERGETSPASCH